MLMHTTHLHAGPHLAFGLYPADRPVAIRAGRTQSEPAPTAATLSHLSTSITRWMTLASPPASAHGVERIVIRERLRLDTLHVSETTHILRGPAGPAGAPRLNAHPAVPAAWSPTEQFANDGFQRIEDTGRDAAVERTPGRDPAARPLPSGFVHDVEALTTQVLNRIERRAIAQRERMGKG